MKFQELIVAVAERSGLSQRKARDVLKETFAVIRSAALQANRVSVAGFGSFSSRARKTSGISPQGGRWSRKATRMVSFMAYVDSGGGARFSPIKTMAEGEEKTPGGTLSAVPEPRATAS